MSSFAQTSAASITDKDRRSQPRRRVEELAYGDFGPHNGGIILDVAEGGFAFQSVEPVDRGKTVFVKIKLPGMGTQIEAKAQVAWLTDSGKRGGLKFLNLPDNSRDQIKTWVARDILDQPLADTANTPIEADAPVLEIPTAPKAVESLPESEGARTATFPPVERVQTVRNVESAESQQAPPPVKSEIPALSPSVHSAPPQTYEHKPQPPLLPEPVAAANPRTAWPVSEPDRANSPAPRGAPIPEFTVPAGATEITAPEAKLNARAVVVEWQRRRSALEPKTPPANARARAYEERMPDPLSRRAMGRPASQAADQPVTPATARHAEAKPLSEDQQGFLNPEKIKSSQLVKLGIAAAIGCCVLIVIAAVPALRTRIQGIPNHPAEVSGNAAGPDFQVEVVNHNGRRWILRDGESAPVPDTIQPSRRETQPAELLRNDTPKQPAGGTKDNAQARLNGAQALTLNKPRLKKPDDAVADVRVPSIFDGITPPIPSFDADPVAPALPDAARPAQPQPAAGTRVANLQAAALTHRVEPSYPDIARQQRLQGEVRVSATVGKDGVPRNLKPLSGDQRLLTAALVAIGQWRYKPATLNGEAIESEVVITFAFQLK